MRGSCRLWPFPRTASGWPPAPMTKPCACGRQKPARQPYHRHRTTPSGARCGEALDAARDVIVRFRLRRLSGGTQLFVAERPTWLTAAAADPATGQYAKVAVADTRVRVI